MAKVCVACGIAPVETKKPAEEAEDCINCGGKETVKEKEAAEEEKKEE